MLVGTIQEGVQQGIWEGVSIVAAVAMMITFGAVNNYIMAKKQ